MSNLDAPHPIGSICPKHGLETMNVYQGGQHRNYCCTVDGCEFQNYRHPCPVCDNYEGGLADDHNTTTPCPECAAKRTAGPDAFGRLHDWLEADPYREIQIVRNPPNQRGWGVTLTNNYFTAAHRHTSVARDASFDTTLELALDQWEHDTRRAEARTRNEATDGD